MIDSHRIAGATKWSAITEILAKIISPVLNIILARILAPDAFGIAATVMMIISFADLFANAGFGKFIIQHEFTNRDEQIKYTNVAFTANLGVSILLFIVLIVFGEIIASWVGCSGYGSAVSISGVLLLITAFSNIQLSLFRRELLFKKMVHVRLIGAAMPLVTTIPLALLGYGYKAILAGYILKEIGTAILLTVQSSWKPRFEFDVHYLKNMFWFSFWSLVEIFGQWIRENISIIIVARMLSSYYVGLYKITLTTVNSICALVYSAIIPVAFSVLSRVQNDDREFNVQFGKFLFLIASMLVPIGIGTLTFSETVTQILLGTQWIKISSFLGVYCFCLAVYSAFSPLFFEAYRAKANPHLSAIVYVIHNTLFVVLLLVFAPYGFDAICWVSAISLLCILPVHIYLGFSKIHLSLARLIAWVAPIAASGIFMAVVGFVCNRYLSGILAKFSALVFSSVVYLAILCLSPSARSVYYSFIRGGKYGESSAD